MTTFTWNGSSADWTTSADWNPVGVPGTDDVAVLGAGAGPYTVTITSAAVQMPASVDIGSADATLFVDGGVIAYTDTISVNSGTLLLQGAVLDGGTSTLDNFTSVEPGGTLDNAADLIVSDAGTQGSALFGSDFENSGEVAVQAATVLQIDGAIFFVTGIAAGNYATSFSNTGSIAIGSQSTLEVGGNYHPSGDFPLQGAMTWTNSGTITAGAQADLQLNEAFTNAGDLAIGSSTGTASTLQLGDTLDTVADPNQQWSNTGTITTVNTDVTIGGNTSLSGLGTLDITGGTVVLDGYLDLGGVTLTVGGDGALTLPAPLGTVQFDNDVLHDATIKDGGGGWSLSAATGPGLILDDVTVDAAVSVAASNFSMQDNTLVRAANDSGQGTITTTGSAFLAIGLNQALDNLFIRLGTSAAISQMSVSATDQVFGPNLTIDASGGSVNDGNTLDNQGTIESVGTGQIFTILGGTVVNDGRLIVDAGAGMDIVGSLGNSTSTFTNNQAIMSAAGSTLELEGPFTNAGSINIGNTLGATATLVLGDPFGSTQAETWTNTGAIVAANASVQIGGHATTGALQGLNLVDSTVTLDGFVENAGTTFSLSGMFAATTLDGVTIDGGTLLTAGGASLELPKSATLQNLIAPEPLVATGGTLTLDNVTIGNTITASGDSAVDIEGTLAFANPGPATIDVSEARLAYDGTGTLNNVAIALGANGILGAATTLTLGPLTRISMLGGAELTGHIISEGSLSLAADTENLINSYTTGPMFNAGSMELGAGGTLFGIAITNQASLLLDDGALMRDGYLTNDGTMTFAGAADPITFQSRAGTLTNNGVVLVKSGTTMLQASMTGSGSVEIAAGATLDLSPSTYYQTTGAPRPGSMMTQVVNFGVPSAGQTSVLALEVNNGFFTGAIAGFAPTDTIDLAAVHYDTGNMGLQTNGNTLDVTDHGSLVASVVLGIGDSVSSPTLRADKNGNSEITACYLAGTRILTARGEIAVERLRVGDHVAVLGGGLAPIRWIGTRRIDCRRHRNPEDVWPVRVPACAFGPSTPHRNLFLSPDHAVAIEGALVPIRFLLNGASIAQVQRDEVHYLHIELPRHAVILAEGLPAESYLDTGNRAAFSNGGDAIAAHPEFALV